MAMIRIIYVELGRILPHHLLFMTDSKMAEKSLPPSPPFFIMLYFKCATWPRGSVSFTESAASFASPRSFSMSSAAKPPV